MSDDIKYPAKKAYQVDEVKVYDEQRFTSLKGKMMDKREKSSVIELMRKYAAKGDYVIDLPVGTARIAEVLLEQEYKVLGADISEQMISLARMKCERFGDRFSVRIEDGEHLSFANDTFDYATSVRLFGHLPDEVKGRILAELMRVSAKGVFVSVYMDSFLQQVKRKIKQMLKPNKAPWYPIRDGSFRKLVEQQNGMICDKKSVLPVFSEGVTYYIRKKS